MEVGDWDEVEFPKWSHYETSRLVIMHRFHWLGIDTPSYLFIYLLFHCSHYEDILITLSE